MCISVKTYIFTYIIFCGILVVLSERNWIQMVNWIYFVIRMIVSCICGIVIGFERKNRAKEAGVRTHCIVACAACLMMIISKYGFYDLIQSAAKSGADVRLDPSRLAQGIVTGVGFLGIGMAIGAGMYFVGISATVIILVIQIVLHHKIKFMTQHKTRSLAVYGVTTESYQNAITDYMDTMGINISEVSIKQNEDATRDYTFYLEMPEDIHEEDIIKGISYRCKIDFIH